MNIVNGVVISGDSPAALRVNAVRELLCQRAAELGLFEDGAAENTAIERLLDLEAQTPEPTEAECRRYYDSHLHEFRSGDLVAARHILFAVTPGTPIDALRGKAEQVLHDLKQAPQRFDELARELSNCPSGEQGGNIGQLSRGECVGEFDAALFENEATGLQPRLVNTRYGFHIVSIEQRVAGKQVPFETAKEQIALRLTEQVATKALAQYVRILAGQARIEGIDLQGVETPLVQ
ncbi:MAG TPA: peptidylprolyl isomerase [Burkholderiales bacterium]|nr:peptidylprolyl isomerase [Burkholderiales bacterium]